MADRDPGAMVPASDDPLLWRSKLPLNDIGNAQRFAALAGGRLKFVGDLGRQGDWVWFDGVRWTAHDAGARARSIALQVSSGLQDESRALATADGEEVRSVYGARWTDDMSKERIGHLFAWAMKTGNSDRTAGMLKQAQGLTDEAGQFVMRADLDSFDTDIYAYHCLNGTIRFADHGADGWTCDFTPGHDPADMFMQVAAVAFDDRAGCPLWRSRLDELHDDPVARTAIQRIYGMTLTGLISDQAFYIFQGRGGDGKSMTDDIVSAMHGDYFRAASPKSFLASRQEKSGSEHQSDMVRLRGDVRLVVVDEPKAGATWDGERIKQVTGSRITARGVNALEEITFVPRWKLIVECNQLPKAPSDDKGFRRRFKLLPWLKSYGVSPGLVDESPRIVKPRLMAEASGILNWMIEGTLAWLDSGEVPEPNMARIAAASFWSSASAMSDWLEANCDVGDPMASEEATLLYQDFKAFCIARGDKEEMIMKQTSFGSKLTEAQYYVDRDKTTGRKRRIGIRLKSGAVAVAGNADLADGWRDSDMGGPIDDPFG